MNISHYVAAIAKTLIAALFLFDMRLVIVSNRLPVTAKIDDGTVKFLESPGGLASGLNTYLESDKPEYVWIGWPGTTVDEEFQSEVTEKAFAEHNCYPVFLSEDDMENFYHGFCNSTIWALFHYFTTYARFEEQYWENYNRVNELFCRTIEKIIRPGDVIWVHDYHLMMLPHMLRQKLGDVPIGFFLHIPFPSFEVFRLLPSDWRSEILEGLLGADLIGFHTHDYVQHFLHCTLRILGHEHHMGEIMLRDRIVKVDTFPMGIDYQKFEQGAANEETAQERLQLKKNLHDERVVLSIDRLDYSKGIAQRLRGFEIFLEANPDWHGKVAMMLVVVPSRIGVEHYQMLKRQIDELVGRINGRFARFDWTPIHYQYRSLSFHPLVALYSISDVILVTPLRDGMNLIAKEYLASRPDGTGVLILSEMAGSARELGEALIMNPNLEEDIADYIRQALSIPVEEQKLRNKPMQKRLKRYDITRWAHDFLEALMNTIDAQRKFDARLLGPRSRSELLSAFRKSHHRLLMFDYDGTLIPFARRPEFATPDHELPKLLNRLGTDSDVVLIAGREKASMENSFGNCGVHLVAEHGVWLKPKGKDWRMLRALSNDWKPQIISLFELYVDRLPGSFIEEKEYSVTFHYRESDPDLAAIRISELTDMLVHYTGNLNVQVLQGSKVVEMRSAGVNKGSAALEFLSRGDFDFILAIGDDWTDDDMFRVLPEKAYSIKVGLDASHARFNLRNVQEVRELLEELAVSAVSASSAVNS